MNIVCFRLVASAITLSLLANSAIATDLRWSLKLHGETGEFIEVLIDTKGLESNAIIDSATFTANVSHEPNAIDPVNLSFLDSRLRALTSGHVYRRLFRHRHLHATNVTSDGLQIQVRASGGKADGYETPAELNEGQVTPDSIPAPDIEIAPPPESAPVQSGGKFNRDRQAFRRAMTQYARLHTEQPPSRIDPQVMRAVKAPRLVYSMNSAPADPKVKTCMDYADAAVTIFAISQSKGCHLASNRWSPVYAHHFDWCLETSQAELSKESIARQTELHGCAGQ